MNRYYPSCSNNPNISGNIPIPVNVERSTLIESKRLMELIFNGMLEILVCSLMQSRILAKKPIIMEAEIAMLLLVQKDRQ